MLVLKNVNKVIIYLVKKRIVFNHSKHGEMHRAVRTATALPPVFLDVSETESSEGHMAPDADRI